MELVTPAQVAVPLTTPIPPPTALLHPSLMEKLRLGSPTSAHMDLATLNRYQTDNEISKILYGLQEASPFPKLPPYFVHQSDAEGGNREESERSTLRHSEDQTPPHAPRKKLVMATNSPPPNGRPSTAGSRSGKLDLGGKNSRNRDSSVSRHKQKGKIPIN